MPYFLDGDCVRKGTKEEPGEVVKCHEDHAAAVAHLRALYVNVEDAGKGGPGSGWHNPPEGTHTAENAPNFAGGPGADRKYGTESDEPPEGTRRCKCTKCGAVVVLPKGKQCNDIKCPACEGGMRQTEPRKDPKAEGESGRQPKPGREKQATHGCTCPECGKSVQVPQGQKCNEVKCPECKAMMKQGTSGEEKAVVASPSYAGFTHGQDSMLGGANQAMGEDDAECKCPKCGKGIPCTARACPYCKESIDRVERGEGDKMETDKSEWSAASVNDLPDSSFLYVESGEKDGEGKTTPRSKRHLPYKNAEGKVDLPHLRNAISRLGQSGTGKGWLTPELRKRLQAKAQGILKKQGGGGDEKSLTVYKSADGTWRWLTLSNWAVVDKEAEVVSEQAYKDAIAHAQETGKWGELDLVHVNGTDVGDCDMMFVLKGGDEPAKLGAGGTWYDTEKATRARQALQAETDYWGVSLKFRFNPARKVRGVYTGDIQVLKHSILPQHMAASYGTAIAVQGGKEMSKQLDEQAAEALRQLGHTEDEIAELAEKQKALPAEEENVVEKEDTPQEETQPEEAVRRTVVDVLRGLFAPKETAPVTSVAEEAGKADEVQDPPKAAEPAETKQAEDESPEEEKVDAGALLQALGETVAKSIGEMVKAELDERDKRLAVLEQQLSALDASVEEKVEQRLRDVPPVVKVAASGVEVTAVPDDKPKGLTFGRHEEGTSEWTKSLLSDIQQVVQEKVEGAKFQM